MIHQLFTISPIIHQILIIYRYWQPMNQWFTNYYPPLFTHSWPLIHHDSPIMHQLFTNDSAIIHQLLIISNPPHYSPIPLVHYYSPLIPMNYHSPILGQSLIKSGTKFSLNKFTIQTIHQSKNNQWITMNYHYSPRNYHSPILEFTH